MELLSYYICFISVSSIWLACNGIATSDGAMQMDTTSCCLHLDEG